MITKRVNNRKRNWIFYPITIKNNILLIRAEYDLPIYEFD